jgi:hypothetical protein
MSRIIKYRAHVNFACKAAAKAISLVYFKSENSRQISGPRCEIGRCARRASRPKREAPPTTLFANILFSCLCRFVPELQGVFTNVVVPKANMRRDTRWRHRDNDSWEKHIVARCARVHTHSICTHGPRILYSLFNIIIMVMRRVIGCRRGNILLMIHERRAYFNWLRRFIAAKCWFSLGITFIEYAIIKDCSFIFLSYHCTAIIRVFPKRFPMKFHWRNQNVSSKFSMFALILSWKFRPNYISSSWTSISDKK